jgi:hypothetical protein|tara:strand:+ start:1318 stop:1548 length:231 start_codon:yes stop_codon:yes gene_type:complete
MSLTGRMLDHIIHEKFMKAEVAKNARVQIELPNGEMYDLTDILLLENTIVGDNETHRLVMRCQKPLWKMGKIIGKL